MATNFKTDSKNSRNWFDKFTRRALAAFGIYSVISTEDSNEPLNQLLDRNCGIDAVGMKGDDTIFLFSRVIEVKPYGDDYDCCATCSVVKSYCA